MLANQIAGNVETIKLQSLTAAVPVDLQANGAPLASDRSPAKAVQPKPFDTKVDDKVSLANKPVAVASSSGDKGPVRAIKHVVESYNLQGKVRTKFMDSHNNVVYQIPSEMVAKMEDQMMTLNVSTDVKG